MEGRMSEILTALGGSAVLLAAVAWLTKSIITHYLSKDVEAYKATLRSETEKALLEHDAIFRGLHSCRAEIIAELYSKLAVAVSATANFLSLVEWGGEPDKTKKYKAAMEKIVDFFMYFDRRRIFLNEELCKQIDDFVDKIRNPAIDFSMYLDEPQFDPPTSREKSKALISAWKSVETNVPKARKSLEEEFRKLLGVNLNENRSSQPKDARDKK
jgi:hypothetical protein